MAPLHFRLFLALGLVLGLSSYVCAQNSGVGIADLPDCAQPCAKNAAALVNCSLTDTACLCSHDQFTSSTETCANTGGVCGVEDRSTTAGVLGELCASQSSSTTSSTTSTGTSTGSSTTTSSTASASTTSKTTSTSTSTSASATSTSTSRTDTVTPPAAPTTPATTLDSGTLNTNAAAGGLTTTPTGSSTLVVVQTVVLPQTTSLNAGALKIDGGMGVYVVLPAILAMGAGLLL